MLRGYAVSALVPYEVLLRREPWKSPSSGRQRQANSKTSLSPFSHPDPLRPELPGSIITSNERTPSLRGKFVSP
jgi:hypothetical protein